MRRAAEILSRRTGETWTPAEIQETVWSWAKTPYELRDAAGENRAATEILEAGDLTGDAIGATPVLRYSLPKASTGKSWRRAATMKVSNELRSAIEDATTAMSEEASQRVQKDQALLKDLSTGTSGQLQNASNSSIGSVAAQPPANSTLPSSPSETDTPVSLPDHLLADLRKEYPHLTEEEIREMSVGWM